MDFKLSDIIVCLTSYYDNRTVIIPKTLGDFIQKNGNEITIVDPSLNNPKTFNTFKDVVTAVDEQGIRNPVLLGLTKAFGLAELPSSMHNIKATVVSMIQDEDSGDYFFIRNSDYNNNIIEYTPQNQYKLFSNFVDWLNNPEKYKTDPIGGFPGNPREFYHPYAKQQHGNSPEEIYNNYVAKTEHLGNATDEQFNGALTAKGFRDAIENPPKKSAKKSVGFFSGLFGGGKAKMITGLVIAGGAALAYLATSSKDYLNKSFNQGSNGA